MLTEEPHLGVAVCKASMRLGTPRYSETARTDRLQPPGRRLGQPASSFKDAQTCVQMRFSTSDESCYGLRLSR